MFKVATSVGFAPDHLRFLPPFMVETRVRVIPLQCMHLPLLRYLELLRMRERAEHYPRVNRKMGVAFAKFWLALRLEGT